MERYSSEKAENEALKMQGIIKDGYANNFSEAEVAIGKLADTFGEATEEWQDFYVGMKKLRGEIFGKLREASDEKRSAYFKRLKDKEMESIASVNDPHKYLAYHISCAGSTGPISSPKLDFDGEYSLIKFYEEILHELSEEKSYTSSPSEYIDGAKRFFAENPGADKPTKLMLEEIVPFVKNASIADIGCGDAPNLEFYLSNGAEHVSLIDPAKNMLDMAQERVELSHEAKIIELSVGDFEKNDLEDESVDVIVSRFSIHYNVDIESAIRSVHKKIKRGGSLFVVSPHPDDKLNQTVFKKDGKDWVRVNLYRTFIVEYPAHEMGEYFSDFVRDNFDVINNRTFTYKELGLGYTNSNNAVLYLHLRKK